MRHTIEEIRGKANQAMMIMVNEGTDLHVQWYSQAAGEHTEAEIILLLADGVVVLGSYMDPDEWGVTGCDETGARLVKVPYEQVTAVYTDRELETMQRCRDADQRLLSYAH